MALYLTRFTYTTEAWRHLIQRPENRTDAVRSAVESVGGVLHGLWYAFGEADGYFLAEYPDSGAAAASIAAIAASGANRTQETTQLLRPEEMVQSLQRAQGVMFRSPG